MTPLSLDQVPDAWDASSAKYDEHVPHFLKGYALECIRLAEVESGHEVLDVAAGTGLVTVAVAPRVARVVAVDFAPKMIERLEKNVGGRANVTARVMDGQRLEIEDGSFDRVLCNFGVIFFPDRVKGFAEMHRVLRPGGRAVVSAWSTLARFEAFALFMSAVQKAAPDLPRPAQPPAALSLADPGRLEAEMREGGFEEVRVESIVGYIEAPSAEVLWARGETLSPPIVAVLQRIGPEAAARARENVIGALRSRFGDGVVKLACEAHYGIGVRS